MNRRTFLISSLATIGTGLFLSKEGEASQIETYYIRAIHAVNLKFIYYVPHPRNQPNHIVVLRTWYDEVFLFRIWYDTKKDLNKLYLTEVKTDKVDFNIAMRQLSLSSLEGKLLHV